MTGYQEIFTDPSYHGQIITMANAHIGNYGANKFEVESNNSQIKGLVVKKFAHHFSRYGVENQLLNDFLISDNVVGIKDIDTRALISYCFLMFSMNWSNKYLESFGPGDDSGWY